MGCISSKIITRSSSFKEELTQSFRRKINGFPMLEDLLSSKNGGDQFVALVCTTNTVTKKLETGVVTHESGTNSDLCGKVNGLETINAWELMADLDGEKEDEQQLHLRKNVGYKVNETNFTNELDNRGISRCRSFHTVEEFDALVQLPHSQSFHFATESNSWVKTRREVISEDSTRSKVVQVDKGSTDAVQLTIVEDRAKAKEGTPIMDYVEINETAGSDPSRSFREEVGVELDSSDLSNLSKSSSVSVQNEKNGVEKGFRRKATAKTLSPLSISPTVKLPQAAVGSPGGWLDLGDEVFPTGDYVTPKFGNFKSPLLGTTILHNSVNNGAVFDPELVAVFEEAMKEMTAEEEDVLKQIAEHEGVVDNDTGEEITDHSERSLGIGFSYK